MADQESGDLEVKQPDAGLAFRAEMTATNIILGYWMYLVGAIVVVLVSVLFYGQYSNWYQGQQRGTTMACAVVLNSLAEEFPDKITVGPPAEGSIGQARAMGPNYLPMLILEDTEENVKKLTDAADGLRAQAEAGSGVAAAECALYAAEAYRMAGDHESQRKALQMVVDSGVGDPMEYAAESAMASVDLAQDKGDDAVARYQRLQSEREGYLAQWASLDLGRAYEQLGRDDDAKQVYADYLAKWPNTAGADEVKARQEALGVADAAPDMPEEAPEPGDG